MAKNKDKILVVSPNTTLIGLIRKILEDEYEILEPQHDDERLKEIIIGDSPDLIIFDVLTSSMNGAEICVQLRQWAEIPTILLYTSLGEEGKFRIFDSISREYLSETYKMGDLVEQVKRRLVHKKTIAADIRKLT